MPMDAMQDEELVKGLFADQARLEGRRLPWESVWREIDERFDPLAGDGWNGAQSPGQVRGQRNFDATGPEGLDRYTAIIGGITVPLGQQWHGYRFADRDLDKLPNVKRWCERARDRMFAIRYAPLSAFQPQIYDAIRQSGKYGSAPFWTGEEVGKGLFYKSLHLSEVWFEENFRGMVDTVHRKVKMPVRLIAQEYGRDALPDKMAKAFADKPETEFEVLTVYRPNPDRQTEALDWRAKPVECIHIAIEDKAIMRRGGYHTMPIAVARDVTSSNDPYGRGRALKVLGTVKGLNEMQRTMLRGAQKQVDPALAFYDDDGINALVTKPGGANPGLVNEDGRLLVAAMPGGGNLPIGYQMVEQERGVVRSGFLEEILKLVLDDKVQRSAAAVLEIASKQGVLVAPFAGRWETEMMGVTGMRELDLALRAGQIEPLPPEVIEAGAVPLPQMDNPLSRMARANEASGLGRLVELLTPAEASNPGITNRVINWEEAGPGVADVLSVRSSWTRSPDEIRAMAEKEAQDKAMAASVESLATVAGATADFAKAGQLQAAA